MPIYSDDENKVDFSSSHPCILYGTRLMQRDLTIFFASRVVLQPTIIAKSLNKWFQASLCEYIRDTFDSDFKIMICWEFSVIFSELCVFTCYIISYKETHRGYSTPPANIYSTDNRPLRNNKQLNQNNDLYLFRNFVAFQNNVRF